MIEIYVHTIYYINGATQSFDYNKPKYFEKGGLDTVPFPDGNAIIINTEQINSVQIKHLTLTEEEYQKRKELLKNK